VIGKLLVCVVITVLQYKPYSSFILIL